MSVRFEQHEHVGVLIIDRPERANAIDLATGLALSEAFDRLDGDEATRVVILAATGDRAFCAGMDLDAVRAGQAADINGLPGGFAGVVRRDFPKPIIAAVEGAALGGGFEIVLACDLVVASNRARFGLPEVRLGLIAASGGLLRLPRRIPPVLATELILTGEPIDAGRALALGLINQVTPAGAAREAAFVLAEQIAAHDPRAVRASLQLARSVARGDETEAWKASTELSAWLTTVSAAEEVR